MNEKFDENEFETTMDALMEYLRCLPKATVKMLNLSQYTLLMETASRLTDMLRKTQPEGELTIEFNDLFNLGAISVELDSLTVEKPVEFADIIYKADNLEVYPLTNGKVRLDVTFYRVFKDLA